MVRDWDSVKSTIYDLYVTQGQSLKQVRGVITSQYKFVASERIYKHKIQQWGWRTNRDAGGRIATIRRRRRRHTTITTGGQTSISQGGGASVAVARNNEFRALSPVVSSFQPRSPDLWDTPGSFNLSAVGQDYLPETHEVDHGIDVLQQNTPPRSESDVVDQQDVLGRTLLHRMVSLGALDNVKDILSRGARIDIPDNEGNQPLHLAAVGNYPHIIKYLLKTGAKVNAKGVNGRTPVHLAMGHVQALRTLLGAHPNLLTPDNDGDTALHAALRQLPNKRPRNGGVIEKLLCRGANVNTMNHSGVTPFHMAMEKASHDPEDCYVPLFLERNADINLKTNSGESPFLFFLKNAWTFKHRWCKEILMFLRKGADPNTQVLKEDSLIYDMLNTKRWILYSGYDDVVLQLCETANIHTPSVTGDLPLHCVMRSWVGEDYWGVDGRHVGIAKALLYRGSDPNQPNGKGERPLQILLSCDYYFPSLKSALTCLLDNGADPMLVNSSGDLPIYIVYRCFERNTRDELVEILTDAFIARPENNNGGNTSQPSTVWWRTYRAFCLQHQWSDEARELLEAASSRTSTIMPQDVAEHLPKLLISFTAEAKLQAAKANFLEATGLTPILESTYVARILRDCKNMGIEMDVSWYHFLLDILP